MMKHTHLIGLLLASTAAAHAAAPASATAPASTDSRPALERQDIRAQLSPRRYTTLAAEIGAKVQRLPVAEGGKFKAGQLLVSFDCTLQQAQMQKVRAELQGAEQLLQTNERLAELNSVGKLDLDMAKAAVGKSKADLNASQATLQKCTIAAPFAGRVAEQKVREQQFAQVGQPLLDIIDDSVLELEFLIPSRWLSWIRPGTRFEVQIDETRQSYPAKFIRIGAKVDPVSQSVKVAAAIDGQFKELIAGMSGRVALTPPADAR